ncbi:MAG TPA: aromatic ring-hydroxylating dioxygenase subunit alpha [Burkholderiales bacterium]|nr:aromatic ring-hydroxylating dioxygenase subunit alpha [Burkholderiales bacterium]
MLRTKNPRTQPFPTMPVFNNWDVVAKAWYVALPSRELRRGAVRSMDLCGQWVVLYRGDDRRVRALDGYCAHMGTDLGIGSVVGNDIRCFFHHWRYDGEGRCTHIPCQAEIPSGAKLQAYCVEEKYGFIWVYPDRSAPSGVVEHSELAGEEVVWMHGAPYERRCHHHVTMINGIDPQHLRTVHGIDIAMEMDLHESEAQGLLDITLTGELPAARAVERAARWLLGPRYSYRMRYANASIGCLTMLKGVSWFGSGRPLPELYMIFAYRPLARGRTLVQPIYLARRGAGIKGWLAARFLMWLTKRAMLALQGEDGLVYENMRFQPGALLPMDAPVVRFISHVNRLEASKWSAP